MSIEQNTFVIRRARLADRNRLLAMQAQSMRVLGAKCYSRPEIEAFLTYVGTMDNQLIDEGTYYLVETGGHVVASGGWSRFRSNYVGATDSDPAADLSVAKVRSVFVHPDWTRHGLGRRLMRRSEAEAFSDGFHEIELNATLAGLPFYRALGYEVVRPLSLNLPDRLVFRGMTMRKWLTGTAATVGTATGVVPPCTDEHCCGRAA